MALLYDDSMVVERKGSGQGFDEETGYIKINYGEDSDCCRRLLKLTETLGIRMR